MTFLRGTRGHTLTVSITLELTNAEREPQLVEDTLRYQWEGSNKATAAFNLFLMRQANASGWDLKAISVAKKEPTP